MKVFRNKSRVTYTTLVLANIAGNVAKIGGKNCSSINIRINTVIAYGVQARRKPPEKY
jgi:hypothetical protein